ncbi:MAG: 1-acyl-sn-glycerol-3-phosphate acyltransferase [Halieaceae bacterium]|nr:1-acyl-sn-glycerol-3-phosphate acyltransferase [Halieaceae bacterium]MCP5148096.1 1-acyl-sn-glycerol-3-phosphate acyltransferase [Pseudomonadales bacterium]MCP5167293.1 1-acyl-sn-glycerol-3-phosphate acyltransferase [Pseudomonadales bacterium]MCP5187767.1 1-acyl-sn-glycerol-3-phosphate acyltransferase [Pseudomonadales bacterium]
MIRRLLELSLLPFVGLVLSIFFRRIEISGAENVPADSPVIYTPNHMNSLVDGLLARTQLPRDPRPLASATLWGVTALRPLLAAVGAIPVYRKQDSDDPAYVGKNRDMFAACYEALAGRAAIVLFPEGESHAYPALQQLKTGVARIALGAEQRHGPLAVRIIPVGLNFDARAKFRSRVLISIGQPIDPLADLPPGAMESADAVDSVMAKVEEGIRSVTINYPSWEEARLIGRAASLYNGRHPREPGEESMAGEFSLHKQLADAYLQAKEASPLRVKRVVESVASYDRLLRVLSVQHEHVVQEHPRLLQAIFSLRKLSLFLIRLPLSLLGIFLNALPFFLTRGVSRMKIRADRESTAKIFAGVFIYPACWTVQSMLLAGELLPTIGWWLLAPLSGVASLLFRERHTQLLDELRTYLRLNSHAEMKQELGQRLELVCLEVEELLAYHRRQSG